MKSRMILLAALAAELAGCSSDKEILLPGPRGGPGRL